MQKVFIFLQFHDDVNIYGRVRLRILIDGGGNRRQEGRVYIPTLPSSNAYENNRRRMVDVR
jgi:hypothetical protein